MASSRGEQDEAPRRFVFDPRELWPELDNAGLRRKFSEFVEEHYGPLDHSFDPETPFSARLEMVGFGPCLVDKFRGPVTRMERTRRHIALDGSDDFFLGMNCSGSTLAQRRDREAEFAPGSLMFLSNSEPAAALTKPASVFLSVYIPRARLLELVENADDLVAHPIEVEKPVVRYLRRCLEFLSTTDEFDGDHTVSEHIAATLIDLVALSLKAGREKAELGRMRGLRAARLQMVLEEIKSGFADPEFSPRIVAARLNLSLRYVQDLLHECGSSFSERVLELRLQKARTLLKDSPYSTSPVSEIALASGFGDISYFNRAFRRRFGATPTRSRGGNGTAAEA